MSTSPSLSATARATELLPLPAGPSMATKSAPIRGPSIADREPLSRETPGPNMTRIPGRFSSRPYALERGTGNVYSAAEPNPWRGARTPRGPRTKPQAQSGRPAAVFVRGLRADGGDVDAVCPGEGKVTGKGRAAARLCHWPPSRAVRGDVSGHAGVRASLTMETVIVVSIPGGGYKVGVVQT